VAGRVGTAKPRRRRRPEEAEREILEAADRLLRERPFHELTVDALMRATTLSRKSFYVYFRDRYDLLTRLVAPLRARLDEANAPFLAPTSDPVSSGRAALLAVAEVFVRDGPLIRALAEASRYDAEAERVWRQFNEPVIQAFTKRIRADVASGAIPDPGIDEEAAVRALVGMNLYTLFDQVAGNSKADTEAIVDTLSTIWRRALLPSGTE
jgi:TetR/AcrR family transcriptional regulator, ethionamide resistance regulator